MLDARIVKVRREFTVDVSIHVEPAARLAIFGPSGSGKSTILSCIAGLESPDAGEIRFDGEVYFPPPMPLHRRRLAYLTQKDLLFPHLSVAANVCFGLEDHQAHLTDEWIADLKERLHLGAFWNTPARQISGGQARRVALARMLARRPPLVLLDEPFSALDRPLVNELVQALLHWHSSLRFTLIAVDHRPEILERLCDGVIAVELGRIVQTGAWASLAAKPATPSLARLLAPS